MINDGFYETTYSWEDTNQLSSVYDRVRSINPIGNKIGAKIRIRIGISIFSLISFNNINNHNTNIQYRCYLSE